MNTNNPKPLFVSRLSKRTIPIVLLLACLSVVPCLQAAMTIDSLDGPVTTNEINSFVTFMLTVKPATADGSSGNTVVDVANEYAQGNSGENTKSLGLMYELTGDTRILDRMIYFCDTLLS